MSNTEGINTKVDNTSIHDNWHSTSDMLVIVCYVSLFFVGIVKSTVIAPLLFFLIVISFFNRRIYLLLPAVIIYYDYFLVPFTSLSVYRVFSILLLMRLIYDYRYVKYDIKLWNLIPVLIYSVFAIGTNDIRIGLFSAIDVTVFFFYSITFLKDQNNLRQVMKYFAIACIASIVTGCFVGSGEVLAYQLNGSWRYMNRFSGTFPDPNYCGFIYIFAILACISLKPFKKIINIGAIAALGVGILMTISFTGFIGLSIVLVFYLWITRKLVGKPLFVVISIMIMLYVLYLYGNTHPEIPVIGDVSYRIKAYIMNYNINRSGGSMAMNRVTIYQNILNNYKDQNLLKQLFGFNIATPFYNPSNTVVAHNDYVDMLYNMGLILTIVFYGTIVIRLIKNVKAYRLSGNIIEAFSASALFLWIYYGFVLSMLTEKLFYIVLFV